MRELRRQPFWNFLQKTPQPPALKPLSTARTAGRSDWAERRFRRQPFILLLVFVPENGSKSTESLPHTARSITDYKRCHFHPHSSISISLWTFSHERLTFAFTPESGTHLPSPTGSHAAAHRAKQGRFGWGRYHYPRTVLRGSETLRGRVSERHTLPLLSLGRGALSKNAESLRDSDAFMRVAVPRRRGPAGLRCPLLHPAPHRPSLRFVTLAPRRRERITACVIHRTVPPALPAPCFAQRIRLTRRAAAHRIAP